MQIRDSKSIGIDILFPIILILVGLRLATLQIKTEQSAKLLDPSLIPSNDLYQIQSSNLISDNNLTLDFLNNYYIPLIQ